MGYFPLDRGVREHWIYKDSQYFHVWVEMLFAARYAEEPKTSLHEGELITVNHGEFIFGRISWSKRLGISEQRLRTLISKMQKEEMIIVSTKYRKSTVYLIKNYRLYNQQSNQQEIQSQQGVEADANHQPNVISTSSQPAVNQQSTTKEESNKERRKEGNKEDIKTSRPKQVYDTESIPYRSANYLLTKIKEIKPDVKEPNIQSWANDMKLLIENDKRDPVLVGQVIDWIFKDSFWCTNILSPSKLRKQWDAITMKINKGDEKNGEYGRRDKKFESRRNEQKETGVYSFLDSNGGGGAWKNKI